MFGKKYRMLNIDYVTDSGVVLHPIQALKSFGNVKKGDKGGYIESYSNLSQKGNCWVYDNAKVYGNSEVTDYAMVGEHATVCDTMVRQDSIISGSATLIGSIIKGYTYIDGNALVIHAVVDGCTIKDDAVLKYELARNRFDMVLSNCYVCDNASVEFAAGNGYFIDNACFGSNAMIKSIRDFATVSAFGNTYTIYSNNVSGYIDIFTHDPTDADFYLVSYSEEQAINDIAISLDETLFKDKKEHRRCAEDLLKGLIAIGKNMCR